MRLSGPAPLVDGSQTSLPRCRACVVVLEAVAKHRSRGEGQVPHRRRSRSREACTEEYVCYYYAPPQNDVLCGLIDSGATAGILTKEKPRIAYSFPKVRPHAPDTVQTPSRAGLSLWRRFQLSLWAFGERMQDHDIKYAVKTGVATAMLAAPAFIEATRPTFMEYRGEWALISVSAMPADRCPWHDLTLKPHGSLSSLSSCPLQSARCV